MMGAMRSVLYDLEVYTSRMSVKIKVSMVSFLVFSIVGMKASNLALVIFG